MRLLAVVLLLLAGCAPLPFEATPLVPVSPATTIDQLRGRDWPAPRGRYRLRYSATLHVLGRKVPMEGLLTVDGGQRQVRMVALDSFGITLFNLKIDDNGFEAGSVLPALAEHPRLLALVAEGFGRMLLPPAGAGGDRFIAETDHYSLEQGEGDRQWRSLYGGQSLRRLALHGQESAADWRVRYYRFRLEGGQEIPTALVYDDDRKLVRLILWLENVRKIDD